MQGEPAYHLASNMMPRQHKNQWLQSPCVRNEPWLFRLALFRGSEASRAKGQSRRIWVSVWAVHSRLETRIWGSSGKALGFGLLLFDINVLQMGLSADHFVQGRYCCQRWGSLCSFPLVLMQEDCLTNGSPQCSYCAFSLSLVFIPYFLCLTFPRKKNIWTLIALINVIKASLP